MNPEKKERMGQKGHREFRGPQVPRGHRGIKEGPGRRETEVYRDCLDNQVRKEFRGIKDNPEVGERRGNPETRDIKEIQGILVSPGRKEIKGTRGKRGIPGVKGNKGVKDWPGHPDKMVHQVQTEFVPLSALSVVGFYHTRTCL